MESFRDIFLILFDLFAHMIFALPRLMAIFVFLPFMSSQLVPGLVRFGVAGSLLVFIYPILNDGPNSAEGTGLVFLIFIFIKEIAIGCIIGFVVATPFWAVQSAGYFIDNQRGSAIADSVAPQASDEATSTGIFFLQLYVFLFFVSDGFRTLMELIYQTYTLWPVYEFFPKMEFNFVEFIYGLLSNVMYLAAILAGPIIFFMFMMEFSLALMTRFAPQINVFVLALPLKCGVAFLVMVFYLPIIFYYWNDNMDNIVQLLEGLFRVIE